MKVRIKKERNGFIMEDNNSKYDIRNKINDLTGKEWLKHTKSFYFSEKCADDKDAFNHPAPFLIKDIEWLIEMFTKKGMKVLDPFAGSGTTLISAYNLGRFGVGIDLSDEYRKLSLSRFNKKGMKEGTNFKYIVGDSLIEIPRLKDNFDYIVTSPPYHNILKNNSKGIRKDSKDKRYRSGSRIGVTYYSDLDNDLGNQKTYNDFLILFGKIMKNAFNILNNDKYCSIVISDFTINKVETNVQKDIVEIMSNIGFVFVGTIVLLQDNKPLYPFGYPYKFKINHMHQNIINFIKPGD